jgi:alcohol dehydrogenase class IV
VITDKKFKIKCSIKSPFFYPTFAIIDPKLTFFLPPDLTAFTGMDALSHLIEGYLSLGANLMTDTLALEGIKLVMENLLLAIRDPLNIKARTNMMLAATYGGS